MKKITLTLLLSITSICFSQQKMRTRSGVINFEASVPSFEEVKATNKSVTYILNTETGEIASLAIMKGFQFKVALMEEHFNENYIESDKYPKATFKGKIEGFDLNSLTESPKDFIIKGKLELHGKSNDIIIKAKISKTQAGISILSDYSLNASDFNISIPSFVKSKVSNTVNVKMDAVLK